MFLAITIVHFKYCIAFILKAFIIQIETWTTVNKLLLFLQLLEFYICI